ncbi:hypothetical protein DPMN_108920 [Dreissena polymorpha]|uniref:Uncharacterized protein n=1 Tax=Dreissena polymorpha TaxID=45954 RepID=A0A9D4K9C3_DREPO|nr:hypothetical protein DPMN_108920 [Dreissena polymorpha]
MRGFRRGFRGRGYHPGYPGYMRPVDRNLNPVPSIKPEGWAEEIIQVSGEFETGRIRYFENNWTK